MREKELRLALVCYGGISLAVYMHGVTKEVWRLTRASRAQFDGAEQQGGVEAVYLDLLHAISNDHQVRLRVLTDIVAGASAGGINGVFLARALTTGESLDPLTDLWLDKADVTVLLDPDARPLSRFTKFWAVPIAWLAARSPSSTISSTVERSARGEVRAKLSQFVRARWFAPPFGGELFCGLLLDAFSAMADGPKGPMLLPRGQPLDLFVTMTDFYGYARTMRLNSPPEVEETEHRLICSFRHAPGKASDLDDSISLAFAARATASFPGAFPPFSVRELDRVLAERGERWPQRNAFLADRLCSEEYCAIDDRVLVDGSVLANAPFRPAVAALRQRPARREVDRRFVYIDPKPGRRAFSVTGDRQEGGRRPLPGFFATIFKTISDIPREQPIHDNVEAIEALSSRIRRMTMIVEGMRPEVEARIEAALGRTFFLDSPTTARLKSWRASVQKKAIAEAGYGYFAYGHLKLSLIVEEIARIAARAHRSVDERERQHWRMRIWAAVRAAKLDSMGDVAKVNSDITAFFRTHDVGFRIRRLRNLARRLDEVAGMSVDVDPTSAEAMRDAIFSSLGLYLDREAADFYADLPTSPHDAEDALPLIQRIGERRDLTSIDAIADDRIADALALLGKNDRRAMLFTYLGFAFTDTATLPLLQGEGDGEFDVIKIDRISPDDATAIRTGGAAATLKGIQFNSFGAFFSRAFRENDYLWGRLHAAERLIDIVASSVGGLLDDQAVRAFQRRAFLAILEEEEGRLRAVPSLVPDIRAEIAARDAAEGIARTA